MTGILTAVIESIIFITQKFVCASSVSIACFGKDGTLVFAPFNIRTLAIKFSGIAFDELTFTNAPRVCEAESMLGMNDVITPVKCVLSGRITSTFLFAEIYRL